MNWTLIKSRTFWTVVATFVVVGGNSIVPLLSPAWQGTIMGILSIVTVYFHVNPSQQYSQPQ